MTNTDNRPLFSLTVSEYLKLHSDLMQAQPQKQTELKAERLYAYSIKEGADFFHVCTATFQDWKNRGLVKYSQVGRKLIIDLTGTMELLAKRTK